MGTYAPGKIPQGKGGVDPAWLFRELQKLATSVNYLDVNNFAGQKVSGSDLLTDKSVGFSQFSGGEWRVPIVALAAAYTTTATALTNVGPYAYYDAARWAGLTAANFSLEVTAGPSAAGTMTVELHDSAGALVSIPITTVGLNWYTQTFTRLPSASSTLVLKVKSSVSTVSAQLLGASILIRP